MTLTRSFKKTVAARADGDPAFAKALLDQAGTLFLHGDALGARVALGDLINATIGFEALAFETKLPSTSLRRMLSERGNPRMDNIATIFAILRGRLARDVHRQIVRNDPKC
jgi:DNA-binding phage protein